MDAAASNDHPIGDESQRAAAERVLAALYLIGAVLALVTTVAPGDSRTSVGGLLAASAASLAIPLIVVRMRGRLPPVAMQALVALGTLVIEGGIYATGGEPSAASMLLVWVAIFAAYFFTRRAMIAHLAWIAATYAALLVVKPPDYSGVSNWITTVVTVSVSAAAVRVLRERLDQTIARLERLAVSDTLTGVANRRGWTQRAAIETARAARSGEPLALALVDLDRFKDFNDAHGHAAGDRLLVAAAQAWSAALRDVDFLARVGGDEFAVLLPNSGEDEARAVAERLARAMPDGSSCSVGIACWRRGESLDETLARADAALYETKRKDGDRLRL